ncbi:MAG: phospholipase D-like domain-containing protein [Longimicrobiales bacterium]|nr:phospholipase D-like domain-containing protein [Longimicrobiales bacterium]
MMRSVGSGYDDGEEEDAIGERLGRHASARDVLRSAMSRATGARAIHGNRVALQFEGPATFDRWLEVIGEAREFIYFENYIVRDDPIGRAFRDALIAKAGEGVAVRVIHDWVGCWATPRRFWRAWREAGIEVLAFNRPSLRNPFGVMQRDHRKLVCIDGHTAFSGGFCIGVEWAGTADAPPWRDTGLEVEGPAAIAAARAFERLWGEVYPDIPSRLPDELPPEADEEGRGVPVWIIEGEPGLSRVYRTLQLVAAHAQERIWITDPYFVAPPPVAHGLAEAARAGVDVRVLLPAHNNWPLVGTFSRAGYRGLLEAGVRLFEWQGPMIHAKTVVADGVWSRIGSSNLNAASLIGNWEIDFGVLDPGLAAQVEGLFLADLASSVEIVLPGRLPADDRLLGEVRTRTTSLDPQGSVSERIQRELRAGVVPGTGLRVADFVRAGSTFGDALAGRRRLGREDRTVLGLVAVLALPVAFLAALFPSGAGWTLAVILAWIGGVAAVRAWIESRRARRIEPDLDDTSEKSVSERGADSTFTNEGKKR